MGRKWVAKLTLTQLLLISSYIDGIWKWLNNRFCDWTKPYHKKFGAVFQEFWKATVKKNEEKEMKGCSSYI